jgi:hypothetical protein
LTVKLDVVFSIYDLVGFPYQPGDHPGMRTLFVKSTKGKYIVENNIAIVAAFLFCMPLGALVVDHWDILVCELQ